MNRRTFFSTLLALPLAPRLLSHNDVQKRMPDFVEDLVTGIRIQFATRDMLTRPGRVIPVLLPRLERPFVRESSEVTTQ